MECNKGFDHCSHCYQRQFFIPHIKWRGIEVVSDVSPFLSLPKGGGQTDLFRGGWMTGCCFVYCCF